MSERLFFTIRYGRVIMDDPEFPGGYIVEETKQVETSDPKEAYDMATEIAESTGMPVDIKCRALNIERTIKPEYLQQKVHPDHL